MNTHFGMALMLSLTALFGCVRSAEEIAELSMTRWNAQYPAGTVFHNPSGDGGFRLKVDVRVGMQARSADVESFGSESRAEPNQEVPKYMAKCIRSQC